MTQGIYLTELRLRQFRSFAELDVCLDPKPGVLIVHGSNGLGKSSLFQGIEWLLTDQIDQFRNADGVKRAGRYLCRWRKPAAEETSVSLGFSDGGQLKRSLASRRAVRSVLSGVDDVAAYLKSDQWTAPIRDLSHYLLLTHVLSQTNPSRLAYREAGERFDILRDAAHSEIELRIGRNLHGPGTTAQARAFKALIAQLEKEASEFSDLLEQEAATWGEAQLAGAIDGDTASALAEHILTLIADIPPTPALLLDLEPNSLAERLADAEAYLRKRAADLAAARRLRREHADNGEAQSFLEAALSAAETRIAALPSLLKNLATRREIVGKRLSTAALALAEAVGRVTMIGGLRAGQTMLLELEAEQAALAASAEALNQDCRAAEAQQVRLERERRLIDRLERQAEEQAQAIAAVEAKLAEIDAIVDLDFERAAASVELKRLQDAHPGWGEVLRATEMKVQASESALSGLRASVTGLREATGAISAAVVQIVGHLPADTCECPVCATTFDAPGELTRRAREAAERLAPQLERQQSDLDEAEAHHTELRAELNRFAALVRTIEDAQKRVATSRENWTKRLDGAGRADANLTSLVTERTLTEAALDRLRRERSRTRRWRLAFEQRASYRAGALREASRRRDLAVSRLQSEAVRRAQVLTSLATARSDTARLTMTLLDGQNVDQDRLIEAAAACEQAAEVARAEHEAAQAEAVTIDAEHNRLRTEQATLEAERQSRIEDLNHLRVEAMRFATEWTLLGELGAIDSEEAQALTDAEADLSAKARNQSEAVAQLERLRVGRLAWSRQQSHLAALERLRLAVDGADTARREDLRTAAQGRRDARLARRVRVIEAKTIAERASNQIETALHAFNSDYIRPLDLLMTRINKSILCDPRIGIKLKIGARKVEQAAIKEDELLSEFGDVDPLLVHSEGQMAALAVSMLCAASLTFPWSRWRALVLDDPLQHNDAIHAAAFADFMGNLVDTRGYQVLMSTHEASQAEFLQRKFRARSIPCTVVSLWGMGHDGVEESIQSPEVAAG